MDNRSYYKKQSISKKKKGLLLKVKSMVSSVWSRESSPVEMDQDDPQKEQSPSTPQPSTRTKDAFSTPTQGTIGIEDVNKTPNVLLSEFFQQKGDKPLTPIEYEGVMSLLTQSQKKANNGVRSPLMPGSFTRYDSPVKSPVKVNKDLVESTPSHQTLLRNVAAGDDEDVGGSVFATPEYKPNYPVIAANNSVRKSVPSVKRVYQFSGLPSPYRTKIKAPQLHQNNKRFQQFSAGSNDVGVGESSIRDGPKTINKAASTLLSVLEDSKENTDYLQQFSNPYMGKVTKRTNPLTADVINSTIMFDQSTDINTVSATSSITTPAGDSVSVANTDPNGVSVPISHPQIASLKEGNRPTSTVASVFGGSSRDVSREGSRETANALNDNSTPSESEKDLKTEPIEKPENKQELPTQDAKKQEPPKQQFNFSGNPAPSFNFGEKEKSQKPFSFGQSASSSQPAPLSQPSQPSQPFQQSQPPQSTSTAQPSQSSSFSFAPKPQPVPKPQFEFPIITPVQTPLDQTKVNEYKSLFSFPV